MPKAPVAFFAYNRPEHTRRSLESFAECRIFTAKRDCRPEQSDYLFRTSINLQRKNMQLRTSKGIEQGNI
jgi:hypothetical protein